MNNQELKKFMIRFNSPLYKDEIIEYCNRYGTLMYGFIHSDDESIIDIVFINTYETTTKLSCKYNIPRHTFKHHYSIYDTILYDKGFIGGDIDLNININAIAYKYWYNMFKNTHISKIYKIHHLFYSFNNFLGWFKMNYYTIDSLDNTMVLVCDIINQSSITFSPETCCFINKSVYRFLKARDTSSASLPNGVFRYPNGDHYIIGHKPFQEIRYINIPMKRGVTKKEAFLEYKKIKEEDIRDAVNYKLLLDKQIINNPIAYNIYSRCKNWKVKEYYNYLNDITCY